MTALAIKNAEAASSLSTDEERWAAVHAPRSARRRHLLLFGAHDRRLLPAVVRRAACTARKRLASMRRRAAAEAAGFRPCKRCRPNEAPLAERHAAAVAKACRADRGGGRIARPRSAGQRRRHEPVPFSSRVQGATGVTPKAYAAAHRAQRVRESLPAAPPSPMRSTTPASTPSGRFYATSPSGLGMTPTRFRAGGSGRVDPLRGRRMLARLDPRRGDRPGHLRDLARRRSRRAGARSAGPLPQGEAHRRRRRVRALGGRRSSVSSKRRDSASTCRSTCAARRSSSAVWQALREIPAGSTASYTEIADAHRRAAGGARGGAGLRGECARGRDSMPPRRAHRRRAVGLSLGRRAQARAARARGEVVNVADAAGSGARRAGVAKRVAALDWQRIAADLDAYGCAVVPALLAPEECKPRGALRRRQAVPQPGRDGAPRLRPRRIPIFRLSAARPRRGAARGALSAARRDRQSLERDDGNRRPLSGRARRFSRPAAIAPARRGRRRCSSTTGPATTTACIRTSTASTSFRCRSRVLLSSPERDFTGGEFVLTEQRPRMQSRAEVVPLRAGRRRDLPGAPPPRAGHARHLPRQHAPRRQPAAVGPSPHARHHFSRRRLKPISRKQRPASSPFQIGGRPPYFWRGRGASSPPARRMSAAPFSAQRCDGLHSSRGCSL